MESVLTVKRQGEQSTKADLSAKTESATSFALHVLLSFNFKNSAFGGPIWTKGWKSTNLKKET